MPPAGAHGAVGAAGAHAAHGDQVVASSLRHTVHAVHPGHAGVQGGAGATGAQGVSEAVARHTTSVVAMFAVALCCSVAVLLAFAIARNSRHRRQQLLRLHSMEDLVLRAPRHGRHGRHTDALAEGLTDGPHIRDGPDPGPELW